MTFRILVVCAANVCRSPVAAALLRQSFAGTELRECAQVSSGGLHTWREVAVCTELTDGLLGPDESELLRRHVPEPVVEDDLAESALVLAADRGIRSALVRMMPSAHDRTFTLREAAALATHVVSSSTAIRRGDATDWMRQLVEEMNDSRGLIAMPAVSSYRRTSLPWPRIRVHEYDVPDPHDGPVPHRVVRDLLAEGCADLTAALIPTR